MPSDVHLKYSILYPRFSKSLHLFNIAGCSIPLTIIVPPCFPATAASNAQLSLSVPPDVKYILSASVPISPAIFALASSTALYYFFHIHILTMDSHNHLSYTAT